MDRPVSELKDDELYTLFRRYAFREYLGDGNRRQKLDEIFEELARRNPAVGFSAIDDTIDSLEGYEALYGRLAAMSSNAGEDEGSGNARVMLGEPVTAGPGLPRFDEVRETIGMDELLAVIRNSNIFVCRVAGDSMTGAGILDKAMLFVEKVKFPRSGDIIVATYDNEMFVKRLTISDGEVRLVSENDLYDDIVINPDMVFIIHGVVRGVFQVPK